MVAGNGISDNISVLKNKSTVGAISFNTKADFTAGDDALALAINDYDGDGKSDIAVVNWGDSDVSVYRNLTLTTPAPTVSSISPLSGKVGDAVTITGTNFDTTPASNVVWIGGAQATVTSASTTSLTVSVPAGATFDRVSVTVNNRTAQSDDFFMTTFDGEFPTIDASSLADKVDFSTGTFPSLMAIGDVDGDGKLDMAVANVNSDNVSVFLNSGSAGTVSFATKVDYAETTDPVDVTFGDVDGDGELDMAVSDWSSGAGTQVSVLRNLSTLGTVSFAAEVDFTAGSSPTGTAIGDLDGDGKLDLAVAKDTDNAVAVLRNTTTAGTIDASSFAAKVDFTTANGANHAAIGDLDGDGVPDLAVVARAGSQISVLRNTSTPGTIDASSFAAKVDFLTGTSPNEVVIADFDGDSKNDMAIQNLASINISVFRNTSTPGTITAGSFAARVNFATGTGPQVVATGDIDGDGKLDLATPNFNVNTISVFRNTSTSGTIDASSFSPKADFSTGTGPSGIAIADLDGDGKPDVTATNFNANTVSVYRNLTTTIPLPTIATFSPLSGRVGKTISITGTNFDAIAGNNSVYFGATKANASTATSTSLTVDVPVGATFSPITVNRSNRVTESKGFFVPTFSSAAATIDASTFAAKVDFVTGTDPSSLTIADFDGDGKPDLAAPNRTSNTVSVLRNTSSTGLIDASSFATKIDLTSAVKPDGISVGDLDGDGSIDIAAAHDNPTNVVSVFRNTSSSGAVSFATKVDFTVGTSAHGVEIADLDGDGKLDFVTANGGANTVSVIRNTSVSGAITSNSFAAKVDFATDLGPQRLSIADLDGDGKPDLAVGTATGDAVSVLRNTATFGIVDGTSFAGNVDFGAGDFANGVIIADMDGDEKSDLTVANSSDNTFSMIRNTSTSGSLTARRSLRRWMLRRMQIRGGCRSEI